MAREEPPGGGRRRRSARLSAMGRGGSVAFLGAVACLCFLAPVAEGFKKRGPSVTAKVTLARGRGGSAGREASPAAGLRRVGIGRS